MSRATMLRLPPVETTLISLPVDRMLTTRLGREAGCAVLPVESHTFPDGETYLRLTAPPLHGDVAIVATLREPNQSLVPLLLLADAARQWGATHVGLVAPYIPYMRQDAVFRDGEAISARSFARILSRSFDWLVTIDPHLHRISRLSEIYTIPARALHATTVIGEWIARHVERPLIVGPDEESRQWAEAVAAAARAPSVVLTKTRRGDADVRIALPDDIDVFLPRVPVLVDDITSTGTTMAATVSRLVDRGFPPPVCIAVHAVFVPGAVDAIEAAGACCVVSTNTLPHVTNRIDVVPLLANAIARPHARRHRAAAIGSR